MYVDLVNERAKGELVINWLGGPEIIDRFDQGDAVSRGVIDISNLPASYFHALVPAGYALCILAENTPMREHEIGWTDLMVEVNAKGNIRFLTRTETNQTFHFGLKQPIESPESFKGKRMRVASLYNYFMEALGAVPVTIGHTEVYPALERGVVDGYGFPFSDVTDLSLYEVCGYFADHTVYEAGNLIAILNLDKWNSIPKHLQDLMIQAGIDLEPQIYDIFGRDQAAARQKMIDEGMVPVKFSPDDAKWYRDLAFSSFREGVRGLMSPELFDRVVKVTAKQ